MANRIHPPVPTPPAPTRIDLRVEHNALGQAVRVFVGPLDVTHLVALVQSNTSVSGTVQEVVLRNFYPRPRSAPPTSKSFRPPHGGYPEPAQ